MSVEGLGQAVCQGEEDIQVGGVEKFDDLDVGVARAGLVGEMQADGVVVEAGDKVAERLRRLGVDDLAVRHPRRNDAELVRA